MDDPLHRLERWYRGQCDGEWEHHYGVKIDTLDNPGWHVAIDLAATSLDGRSFQGTDMEWAEDDWITSRIEADGRFHSYCGPTNLWGAVKEFLDWAENPDQP
jgi:hypothetical protein